MFLRIFHSYTLWKMKIDLICCAKRKSKWGMEFIQCVFFCKKNLFDSLIACITTAKRTFYISPTRMITFFVEIVFGCSRFAKNWKFNKKKTLQNGWAIIIIVKLNRRYLKGKKTNNFSLFTLLYGSGHFDYASLTNSLYYLRFPIKVCVLSCVFVCACHWQKFVGALLPLKCI